MALEAVVLDVLKSLEITSPPPQVNVGDPVDLGLIPPGLNAFDLLKVPPKLFDIVINNITLDDVAIDLSDINLGPVDPSGEEKFQLTLDANNLPGSAPGAIDLQLVSKSVEFDPLSPPTGTTATDINTNEASLHALPHLIPTPALILSTAVKGLLSRITGTVRQVEKFSGGITGNIVGHGKGRITGTIKNLTGSVTAPKLSDSEIKPTVEWYIEDGNGKRLAEDIDFVMLNKTTLTSPAPSLMFLPVFAELNDGVDLISRLRIFCEVTVTVVGEEPEKRRLGPVGMVLPKIQLPTVLVMAEHAATGVDYPGAVLVVVPSQSLLTLDQLTGKLREVEVALDRLKTISQVVDFGETTGQINRIIELIGNPRIRIPRFLKADQVMDLYSVMRVPGGLIGWGYKGWNECLSSLVMIGPPGRSARFYKATEVKVDESGFQIILGRKGVGYIDNLTSRSPGCKPIGTGGCTFRPLLGQDIVLLSSYNDIIRSYEFLPLQ